MKCLVVVDMQNDFISGSLGSEHAAAILPAVISKIKSFKGTIIYTRDTHHSNYLLTQEGKRLPVSHCISGSSGWELASEIKAELLEHSTVIDKPSFGSLELADYLQKENKKDVVESIEFIGLCTDICIISNAIIAKAALPEAEVIVDASCCAGVTKESHQLALEAMKMCQITVTNAAN